MNTEKKRKYNREYSKSLRGKERNEFLKEMKKSFLTNFKVQIGCRDCNVDDPVLLVLHYTGNGYHRRGLELAVCGWSYIFKAIKNFEVFCWNHHALEHEQLKISPEVTP